MIWRIKSYLNKLEYFKPMVSFFIEWITSVPQLHMCTLHANTNGKEVLLLQITLNLGILEQKG